MNHDHHGSGHAPSSPRPEQRAGGSRTKIVFAILLAIAAFFLLTEHRAHVFGYLPFILLLACPLLHMFHHGGHGGHAHGADDEPRREDAQQTPRKET
jgi:hypothetical protein